MILPFDRSRLRERNALDDAEDREDAAGRTPAERLALSLDLSQLVRELSLAAGPWRDVDPCADLAEKARLYAAPLQALGRRR